MANKNRVGNAYHYGQKKIDRLISKIDRRAKNGKNRENVDNTFRSHSHMTRKGERVWSF